MMGKTEQERTKIDVQIAKLNAEYPRLLAEQRESKNRLAVLEDKNKARRSQALMSIQHVRQDGRGHTARIIKAVLEAQVDELLGQDQEYLKLREEILAAKLTLETARDNVTLFFSEQRRLQDLRYSLSETVRTDRTA
jgi:hypothetical protein